MNEFWQEIFTDLNSTSMLMQLGVLVLSFLLAWTINRFVIAKTFIKIPESWRFSVDGVARMLFPLTALFLIHIGQTILQHNNFHISMLKLASTVLMAMTVIRVAIYALRYIFAPSGWLKTTEGLVVGAVWMIATIHLIGLLPDVATFLDNLSFTIGHRKLSLLLLIQSALIVVVTLIATLWAGRVLENRLMQADQLDMNLRVVLSKLLRVTLIVVGVLTALSMVGFDITLLSVFGGALGVGLGFGLQKIASNYVSGFIILLDRSLHLGDVLTVDGHYGIAHQLRARYLVLRKLDGTEVVIPNDTLITSTVINHSLSDRKAQLQVTVQVSYDSDLNLVMNVMRESAIGVPRILETPGTDVAIKELAENGITLGLSAWVNDPENGYGGLQSLLYMNILQGFKAHGIHIPSPQRDVRLFDQTNSQTGK